MSDNTNNVEPITTSADSDKPGQPVGTAGMFVVPNGCKPLPIKPDGSVDWEAAGFEVLVYTRKDPEKLEAVTLKSGKSVAMPVLAPANTARMRDYIPDEAIIAALDGNGLRVKGQDVARAYATWLLEQKVAHLAWDADTKELTGSYLTTYLQKVWARYVGIRLERGPVAVKVVEKIVTKVIVPLMDGTMWERPAGMDDTEAVNDLRSSYLNGMLEAGLPIPVARSAVEKMDFWKMLGLEAPAEVAG